VVWRHPEGRLRLSADDVHVWVADLDLARSRDPALDSTLSPEELLRGERFRRPRDRARFVASRGVLRRLLAGYLALPAHALRFTSGPHGKPALSEKSNALDLRFNASRRGEVALYAFALGREVGVDVERVDTGFATREVAERFFSVSEVETLRRLSDEEQIEAFFNCWTRKEAYLKAVGTGLSTELDSFDVSLAPGAPAALLRAAGGHAETARWTLHALRPNPGSVGALAFESGPTELSLWRFPPRAWLTI